MQPSEWIIKNGVVIQLTFEKRVLNFIIFVALVPVEHQECGNLWNVGIWSCLGSFH